MNKIIEKICNACGAKIQEKETVNSTQVVSVVLDIVAEISDPNQFSHEHKGYGMAQEFLRWIEKQMPFSSEDYKHAKIIAVKHPNVSRCISLQNVNMKDVEFLKKLFPLGVPESING